MERPTGRTSLTRGALVCWLCPGHGEVMIGLLPQPVKTSTGVAAPSLEPEVPAGGMDTVLQDQAVSRLYAYETEVPGEGDGKDAAA